MVEKRSKKDSKLIVFVNGYTYGCFPLKPYWTEKGDQFLNRSATFFGGDNTFYFVNGEGRWYSFAHNRFQQGRKFVLDNSVELLPLFSSKVEVNFVSHSMGAAFAEGMILELSKLKIPIRNVVHFSVADAQKIEIPKETLHIKRIQLSVSGDKTLRKANPFTPSKKYRIPQVKFYGHLKTNVHQLHPEVLPKDQLKWDFHYDTKTYGYVWDAVKILEQNSFRFCKVEKSSESRFLLPSQKVTLYQLEFPKSDIKFKHIYHQEKLYSLINSNEMLYKIV